MHSAQQRILLKLTGNIFFNDTELVDSAFIDNLVLQVKQLSAKYQFGIVVGGGNIFRGSQQGKRLGLSSWAAHTCGMIATLINGVALRDKFIKAGIPATLVSALACPEIAESISQQAVEEGLKTGACIIFAGGTGNPYFTTDTNAVLRALEIGATQIWKGTSVTGVFDADPRQNQKANLLKTVTYQQALAQNLGIMDSTAFTLAQEHGLTIRVFDIFEPNALLTVARDPEYGTIIQ
jgi:uridylate kinase